MTDESDGTGAERPSKSERKRQSDELQRLGEELIDLPQAVFDDLPLPDELRDAVALARRITKHGGLYRQRQYIGKLMRKIDAEPIRAALDQRRDRGRAAALQFRRAEQWRDRLITEGAAALPRFLAEYPQAPKAELTELMTRAWQERHEQRPPTAARELFRCVRDAMVQTEQR
ncbi:MAG: ribosome biogenesis factor YjgA [Steroidobacteraceae bacterium]